MRRLHRYLPLWCSPVTESSLSHAHEDSDHRDEVERLNCDNCFMRSTRIEYQRDRLCDLTIDDLTMREFDLCEYPSGHLRRAVLTNIRLRPTRFVAIVPSNERCISLANRRVWHVGALRRA